MKEFKDFIRTLADESGGVIRSYFRSSFNVETKADASPVTVADKKAEELLRERIMKAYPDHGIVGEEFGKHNEKAEYQWILDPIDGTKSFICGMATFGTLIGLLHGGRPVLGAIHQPITGEFLIGDCETARLNDQPVRVRECTRVADAVVLTTDHVYVEQFKKMEGFEKLIREARMYRTWGDCYGYLLLSCGLADVMIDPKMSIWDTAALVPVVRGAGGTITDFNGSDAIRGDSVIAAGPALHPEIIRRLN